MLITPYFELDSKMMFLIISTLPLFPLYLFLSQFPRMVLFFCLLFKQLYRDIIHIPVHPFKMYNSKVFSIFIELSNHHHCLIQVYIHHPQKNSLAITPIPPGNHKTFCLHGFAYSGHFI